MKKLLALVLCVMMFVSVLPTAAFAGSYDPNVDVNTVSSYNKQIKNMIKNTKSNIENAYKSLAADQMVYASAKAMDDTVVEMVNGIADNLIAKGEFTKTEADYVKNAIRHYLDVAVADKIDDNLYKALDKDGKVDDLKYAQVVADAINSALTDKTFIKGYEAVATYYAMAQIVKDINKNLKDEYNNWRDGLDDSFQTKFAAQYTTLVDDYIDTIYTRELKYATAALALAAFDEALEEAEDAYDTAVDKADAAYEKAVADKRTEYENAAELAQIERDLAESKAGIKKEQRDAEYTGYRDQKVETAQDTYDAAMEAAAKITDPYERAKAEAEAKADYDTAVAQADAALKIDLDNISIDYKREMKTAKDDYDNAVDAKRTAYETADKAATKTYDKAVDAAEAAYDKAVEEATAEYGPDMVFEVNPWAIFPVALPGSWSD